MNTPPPSRTARKVAQNVLALGSRGGVEDILPPGIVDATARLLVESGVVGTAGVRFARSRLAAGIYRCFDWLMPGQFEAFAHRKAFCERQVRRGIGSGATQVLVLGAGYDTLGWRLSPEFTEVRFFEVDHPPTARLKAKGIEAMGRRSNLHLEAADLSARPLSDVLRANSAWDGSAPTVILAEGLLMYLRAASVAGLLRQCAAVAGTGSRLAFTYVGTRPDGRPDAGPWTGLVLRVLEAGGEPWMWSTRPDALGPLLDAHGWRLDAGETIGSTRRGVEFFGVAVL